MTSKRKPRATKRRPAVRKPSVRSQEGLRVAFGAAQIARRVRSMAREIERDVQGKPLVVVGVLENCFMFMADLVRQIKSPVACQFVRAEIHDETSAAGGPVRAIHYIPKFEATGKDVLLVDGILQSGLTLDHLIRSLELQGARSVRTATLIEKTDELKTDVRRDYVGFKTRGKFLMGYGLSDRSGSCRNLPYIAARTGASFSYRRDLDASARMRRTQGEAPRDGTGKNS